MKNTQNIWQKLATVRDRTWIWVLFAIGCLQFANTLTHDYAWDDTLVITENSRVQKGFAGIPEIWQERDRRLQEDFAGFRPIPQTMFAIEIGLFGSSPFASHLVNVLLFGLLCTVIFKFLRSLFRDIHPLFAVAVTLLFAVHPLHTEVVANIKSRDELLACLFGISALVYFIRFHRSRKLIFWLPIIGFQILAILSKESGYLFLGAYPLLLLTTLKGTMRQKWISAAVIPAIFIGISVTVVILTGHLPGKITQVETIGFMESPELGNPFMADSDASSLLNRITNGNALLYRYLLKFIAPYPLTYFSGYNQIEMVNFGQPLPTLLLLLTLGILGFIGFTLYKKRQLSPLLIGILWFILFMSIYLNIVLFVADAMADRFTFIASIGLCMSLVWGIWKMGKLGNIWGKNVDKAGGKQVVQAGAPQKLAIATIALLLMIFAARTVHRNMAWANSLTLFETDMPHLENAAKPHYYLAEELSRALNDQPNNAALRDRMFHHYARSLEISELGYYTFIDYGRNLNRFSRFQEAEKVLSRAVALFPEWPDPWFYLGKAQFFQEKFAPAVPNLQKAYELAPNDQEIIELYGRSLERAGQFDRAVQILQPAAKSTGNIMIKDALADAYFYGGDYHTAAEVVSTLISADPRNPTWWRKLLGFYQLAGDTALFQENYAIALENGIAL